MPRFTLSKKERLSSLKEIDQLFSEGQSLTHFPIRLVWKEIPPTEDTCPPVLVMFSAPKKKFPKAVDRNRIKRLLRESYRLIKPEIFARIKPSHHYNLSILFSGNEVPEFDIIQKAVHGSLERWIRKINQNTPPRDIIKTQD